MKHISKSNNSPYRHSPYAWHESQEPRSSPQESSPLINCAYPSTQRFNIGLTHTFKIPHDSPKDLTQVVIKPSSFQQAKHKHKRNTSQNQTPPLKNTHHIHGTNLTNHITHLKSQVHLLTVITLLASDSTLGLLTHIFKLTCKGWCLILRCLYVSVPLSKAGGFNITTWVESLSDYHMHGINLKYRITHLKESSPLKL